MAKDSLTQKDIDDLLSEMQKKQRPEPEDKPKEERTIFKYNFKSQKKVSKGQLLILENIHKRFLRNIETSLTNLLNIPVIANLATATELPYYEFSESISSPSCLYLLDVSPGYGKLILDLDLKFAFFVIDKVLGGSSDADASLNRELSLIEERIMYRIINLLIKDLEDAWSLVASLKLRIDGFYAESDYIQVIGPTDKIFLMSVDIRSEKGLGFLNICIPIDVLETFVSKNQANQPQTNLNRTDDEIRQDRALIRQQMKNARVQLRAVLGKVNVMVNELIDLEPGDTLRLDSKVNQPIDVVMGNSRLYKAIPEQRDKMLGVKVLETMGNDPIT